MAGANYFGLICGIASLAAFALTHRRATGRSGRPTGVMWAAVGLLAAPAFYQAAYYLHVLPETTWFYEARSWPGMEAWVIPLGAAGGLLAARLPRRFLVLPLLATAGAAVGPFLKPVLAPLPEREFRDIWVKEACIQSTQATCGPASLATVLRSLGVERREREIARSAHSYLGGTEAWYLARYARAQGARARFRKTTEFPSAAKWPAIVGVKVEGGRGHFIPILRQEDGGFVVGDPMIGLERLTRAELERRYEFTGFALEVGLAGER